MPDDELARKLAAEVSALSEQIGDLHRRVAALEVREGVTAQFARASPTSISAIAQEARSASSGNIGGNTEGNTGLKLLNRAGAVTLFLGIIFFFKYAVDNEWIGASGRVLLGIVAGCLLFAAGEWLRKRGQGTFAQGVGACGVATIYISVYAACAYYKLISGLICFLALLAICVLAVALARKRGDAVLAVVGFLFAVAAAGLFKQMDPQAWGPSVWSWFGFLFLLGVQASSIWRTASEWKPVLVPVVSVAVALQAFWLVNPGHPVVCVLFFLALAAAHFRSRLSSGYLAGHLFVLLAGLRFLFFWFEATGSTERSSLLSETESVFLAIYGSALLVAAVMRRSASDRMLGLALLAIVILKLYAIDVWVLTRFYRISAFIALGVLLLASSFIYSRWKQRKVGD